MSFLLDYGILLVRVLPASSTRCVPSCFVFHSDRGELLEPPLSRKGGLRMVTVSNLIQIGILIVGVIDLFLHLIELDRNEHR